METLGYPDRICQTALRRPGGLVPHLGPVPRDEAERLELAAGQIVYARASRERVFENVIPPSMPVAT